MNQIQYSHGLPEHWVDAAVDLYDQAFADKMAIAIADGSKRQSLIKATINPQAALIAHKGDRLLGLVALKSVDAAFTEDIGLRDMARILGWGSVLRAATVLSMYEAKVKPGELWIDAIAVSPAARGQGVGTALINQVIRRAEAGHFECIKLGVIDTNPRAQQLYESLGFRVIATERFGWMRRFLDFGAAHVMHRAVP